MNPRWPVDPRRSPGGVPVVAVAWLWVGIASSALAREGARPVVEIEAHSAGLRGDSFSTFETRLMVGGTMLAETWRGWRLGLGLDVVWVDQPATSYLYRAVVLRDLPSLGAVVPYVETGVGGVTTRLDVPGVNDTESDWMVPLGAGVRWRKDADAAWGVRVGVTDFIVWQEVPATIPVGGSNPASDDTDVTHNWSVSAGVLLQFGDRPR